MARGREAFDQLKVGDYASLWHSSQPEKLFSFLVIEKKEFTIEIMVLDTKKQSHALKLNSRLCLGRAQGMFGDTSYDIEIFPGSV